MSNHPAGPLGASAVFGSIATNTRRHEMKIVFIAALVLMLWGWFVTVMPPIRQFNIDDRDRGSAIAYTGCFKPGGC